jgi:hypothetical protein
MSTRTKAEIKYLEPNRARTIKVGFDSHIWVQYSRIQARYGESKLPDQCKNYFNAYDLTLYLYDLLRRESKSVLADGLASSCVTFVFQIVMLLLLHLQRRCHQPPFSTSCLAYIKTRISINLHVRYRTVPCGTLPHGRVPCGTVRCLNAAFHVPFEEPSSAFLSSSQLTML